MGKPSKSSTAAIAKLFGNATKAGPSRKRSFDPTAERVVAAQQAKKATNQRMKNKTLSVLSKEKPAVVPKGRSRSKLTESGLIIKLQFKRCLKASEVRNVISDAFSGFQGVEMAQYLRCENNVMLLNENQELDGDDVIDLAGQGSLYLTQKAVTVKCDYFNILCDLKLKGFYVAS